MTEPEVTESELYSIPGDARIINMRWLGEDNEPKGLRHHARYELQVSAYQPGPITVGYFTEISGAQLRFYENVFVFLNEWSTY